MELLIAMFALAGLVWMIPLLGRGKPIVVALTVLVTGTVFGPPFFAIDGPIQFSLDRLLWLVMLGMAVLGWRLGYIRVPSLTRSDWLVVGFVGWFLISTLRGGSVPTGSSPVARWLFYILMPAGMYAIARLIEIRRQDVRWMLHGCVGLGVYLAVTALFEITGAHWGVFPAFIADAEVWEFYGRGRGPLMNPSGNGIVITIALVAAVLGLIYTPRRGKLIYAVITVILLGGVYATLTRSAWLGACSAIALIALVYAPRWVRVLGLASVVVLGGMSVAGVKDQLIRMKRDKNLSASDAEKSMKLRPLLAVVAWEMFKDRPIVGHGYGRYFQHNQAYHSDRSYGLPLDQARSYAQHNVLLSVLVDTGIIGLSMFAAWLATLAGISWRLARQVPSRPESRWYGMLVLGTIMAYLCNGMFQDVMIIPMVHMYLFFIAGAAVTIHQYGFVATSPRRTSDRVAGAAAATA